MKKELTRAMRRLYLGTEKRSPEILIGIGIATMVLSTVFAVKATPKALSLIEKERTEKASKRRSISKKDIVKATWNVYVPSMVMGAVGVTCIIYSSNVQSKRTAAVATAYKISETAFKEYKEQVLETVGLEKEREVREKAARKDIDRAGAPSHEIISSNGGAYICLDKISGRYFKSDANKLLRAENDLNRRMMDEMYVSLNDFYYEIGLSGTDIGDDIGWNIDRGNITLDLDACLNDDMIPCIVLRYNVGPKHDFAHC